LSPESPEPIGGLSHICTTPVSELHIEDLESPEEISFLDLILSPTRGQYQLDSMMLRC
jgi:hypothetical protein